MSTNSIPHPLRDLLSKLAYFAMIERGQKPCMNDMTFVDCGSWYGAYKRTMTGEGRKNMLIQINGIIDQAISAIEEYRGTEFFSLLINGLSRAKTGISNLTSTYSNRPDTVAQIQICLANIDLQLNKNKEYLALPKKEETSDQSEKEMIRNPSQKKAEEIPERKYSLKSKEIQN